MGLIRINYSQAIREANRLKQIADDCSNYNAQIDRLIRNLPSYWQGEAASAFLDSMNQCKKESESIKAEANNLSNTVRRVANEIREAERRAIAAMNKN